jgi:hypothetical protein
MDPDQALLDIRLVCERVMRFIDDPGYEPGEDVDLDDSFKDAANVLAEKFQGLDSWLKAGGFLPKSWSDAKKQVVPVVVE